MEHLPPPPPGQWPSGSAPQFQPCTAAPSKRVTVGVLALTLGGFGVHKFYLGYTKAGVLQILATVFTCGVLGLIPFVEGVLYLAKSDEEFIDTYQIKRKEWF